MTFLINDHILDDQMGFDTLAASTICLAGGIEKEQYKLLIALYSISDTASRICSLAELIQLAQ